MHTPQVYLLQLEKMEMSKVSEVAAQIAHNIALKYDMSIITAGPSQPGSEQEYVFR